MACTEKCLKCIYQSLPSAETNSHALKRRLRELEEEKHDFQKLYQYLTTGPESQARRIRMGADVGSIIRQILYPDLRLHVPLVL